jgi:zinc protease
MNVLSIFRHHPACPGDPIFSANKMDCPDKPGNDGKWGNGIKTLTKLIAAFVFIPSMAFAVDVKTPPAPKGEQIWFVEDHTVPVIAMTAAFPAGSAYDPADKAGLATFAAAMLDEGAGNKNSTAFHAALADKAIQLSVSPGRDYIVVSLITLTENAKDAFALLGLALTKARFDDDAINRVRAQMLTSLRQGDDDPPTVAARGFDQVFFNGHPYGHPTDGDPAGIAAITPDDLKNFAHTHWVRGGLRISVSGDVDQATLNTLLASAFGGIPAITPPPVPPPAKLGAPGMHVIPMPVPQPTAIFGLPGILRSDKDFIPAYVANYILGGGGFSSRLMHDVREKRGLTYDIDTSLVTYRKAGAVAGDVATRADAMKQTLDIVRTTMQTFVDGGPTQKELTDAKTFLTGSFPLAFASNAGIAAQLNSFQRAGLPADYIVNRNALIEAVTVDDVKRVSKRLFNPARLTIVVAGTMVDPKPAKH